MADNDVMKDIAARVKARARRVYDARGATIVPPETLAAQLEELAACWREESEMWRGSKKRGWQTTATKLRDAAMYVAAVALDVRKLEPFTIQDGVPLRGVAAPDESERIEAGEPGEDDVEPTEFVAPAIVHEAIADSTARLEATAAYLAGRIDTPPGTEIVADTRPLPDALVNDSQVPGFAEMIRSGSTLADEVKADQMTNPTPIAGARMLQDPSASTYVPVSLGPRWTFEDLMSRPVPAPPEHWSWSQLTTNEDCGLKDRFQRLEQLPQVPQWALIGGQAFHACVEQIEAGMPVEISDLDEMWRNAFAREIAEQASKTTLPPDKWRASNKGSEGWTWWNESGPDMLKRYVHWRSSNDNADLTVLTIAGKPVIEYECEFVLPGGIRVKLVIDAAYVQQDGSILIIDYKSGKSAGDMAQLGMYAHALVQLLRREPPTGMMPGQIYGAIYDARKGELSTSVDLLATHPLAEYVYRVHTAEATRRAGLYRPRKSSFCGGCAVQYACPLFADKGA